MKYSTRQNYYLKVIILSVSSVVHSSSFLELPPFYLYFINISDTGQLLQGYDCFEISHCIQKAGFLYLHALRIRKTEISYFLMYKSCALENKNDRRLNALKWAMIRTSVLSLWHNGLGSNGFIFISENDLDLLKEDKLKHIILIS